MLLKSSKKPRSLPPKRIMDAVFTMYHHHRATPILTILEGILNLGDYEACTQQAIDELDHKIQHLSDDRERHPCVPGDIAGLGQAILAQQKESVILRTN